MGTFGKVVFVVLIALFLGSQMVSCGECWNKGGTPVKGVITYACVK